MFAAHHRTRSGRVYNRVQCRRCHVLPALLAADSAVNPTAFRLGLCAVCGRRPPSFLTRTVEIVDQARAQGLPIPDAFGEVVWRSRKPMTAQLHDEAARYFRHSLPHDANPPHEVCHETFTKDVLGLVKTSDGVWSVTAAKCRHIPAEFANSLCRIVRRFRDSHPLLNVICALTLEPEQLSKEDCGHGYCYLGMVFEDDRGETAQ